MYEWVHPEPGQYYGGPVWPLAIGQNDSDRYEWEWELEYDDGFLSFGLASGYAYSVDHAILHMMQMAFSRGLSINKYRFRKILQPDFARHWSPWCVNYDSPERKNKTVDFIIERHVESERKDRRKKTWYKDSSRRTSTSGTIW